MKKLTQCYVYQINFHLHQRKEPFSDVSIISRKKQWKKSVLQGRFTCLLTIMESCPYCDNSIYEQISDLSFSFHRPWHWGIYTFAFAFFFLKGFKFHMDPPLSKIFPSLQQTEGNVRISIPSSHTIPNGNLYSSREKSVPSPNLQGAEGLSGKCYMSICSKPHSKGLNTMV